jgi:Holliday junction resolvase RusA-like endonuclease
MILSFTVEGRPVSWARKNVVNGRPLTDKKQREAKRTLHLAALAARPRGWRRDATYEVRVHAYYPDGRQGDCDRIAGLPLDALEGVAYEADRQVVRLEVGRFTDRERPRVEVVVRAIGGAA